MKQEMALVSVVMPVYNSSQYLQEAIDSIRNQTYTNWELLIINEFGSEDGSREIVKLNAEKDPRIKLYQNEKRLGLAESLNLGMRISNGKYIARMDADDLSHSTRLEKQVRIMEADESIGICGTYQHHFGPNIDWVHKPPVNPETCKANLLFDCDLCHSTLMLRKEVFLSNQLFYDSTYMAEDFELWSRAASVTKITNIPEVLGEYRWGEDNITQQKKKELAKEHSVIVAKALMRNLNIKVPETDYILLEGWHNPFRDEKNSKVRKQMFIRMQKLMEQIYEANQSMKYYKNQDLLNIMASKWRSVKYHEPRNAERNVASLKEIFNPYYIPNVMLMWSMFRSSAPTMKNRIKKLIRYIMKR